MPLKTQLCDARGQVIEQILFARLDMPETISDADLTPAVRTEGMRWVRQGASEDSAAPALSAYRASELPPGFQVDGLRNPDARRRDRPRGSSGLLGRPGDGFGVRRSRPDVELGRERFDQSPAGTAHAGAGPRRLGIRILHRRAGSPGHGGGRGSRLGPWSPLPIRSSPSGRFAPLALRAWRCANIMGFLLYSRPGCALCEEMLEELQPDAGNARPSHRGARCGCRARDRESDMGTRFRCSFEGGELVCHGRLDKEELLKALNCHRRPV